ALVSESPAKPWGLTRLVYVVVPWGDRVYLVEPESLLDFCNDVNSGNFRAFPAGGYLLKVEDFRKKASGLPQVPEEYKDHLLKEPVTGSIVQRHGEKGDVAVRGQKLLRSGFSVTLNVGKQHGVRTGMRFYPEEEQDQEVFDVFRELFVISTTAKQCELLVCG